MDDLGVIRVAARGGLLTFSIFVLLVSGVMAASGAFRSIRFLSARVPTITGQTLSFIDQNSLFFPLSPPVTTVPAHHAEHNRLLWLPFEGAERLVIWENGDQRQIPARVSDLRWSPSGLAAWRQNPGGAGMLQVWDGQSIRTLTTDSVRIQGYAWTADNQLWWLQSFSNQTWALKLWDGQQVTTLFDGDDRILKTQFLDCGAALLQLDTQPVIYRLGDSAPIPLVMNPAGLLELSSENCQSFVVQDRPTAFNAETVNWLWDGSTLTPLGLDPNGLHIRGNDELLGLETSQTAYGKWTLHHLHAGGEDTYRVQGLRPSLIAWGENVSVWTLLQREEPGQVVIWHMDTDETHHYPYAGSSNQPYYDYDPAAGRLAWVEHMTSTALYIDLWDEQTSTFRPLRFTTTSNNSLYLGEMHWMSDGTLLVTIGYQATAPLYESLPTQVYLYHWETDQLELFGTVESGTDLFSDWITWE